MRLSWLEKEDRLSCLRNRLVLCKIRQYYHVRSSVQAMLTSFTSFNFRIVSLSFISCSPAALPSISTSTSFFKSEALSPANLPTSVLQGDAVSKMVKKVNSDVENSLKNYILYRISMVDDFAKNA